MENLIKFEGKKVVISYNGPDLPDGSMPPVSLEGEFVWIDSYDSVFKLKSGEMITLINTDINWESISIKK